METPVLSSAILSTSGAARRLGVSRSQVARLAKAGKIPGHRVGSHGQWRFRIEAIEQFLTAGESTGTPQPAQSGPGQLTHPPDC